MKDENAIMRESVLMAREVELAGEFIFSALEKIDTMNNMDENTDSFFVMYHLSVGIERLQKVLLVVLEDVQQENMKKFLKTIKRHNLIKLNSMIQSKIETDFSSEIVGLLDYLSEFYAIHRYNKYDFYSYDIEEENSLSAFLAQYYPDYCNNYYKKFDVHLNDAHIKEFIGRCVGEICQKYYQNIYDISCERNIFCYELSSDSAAQKIFSIGDHDKSYQEDISMEEYAIKELLIYLMNTKESNALFSFIRKIEPLDIDIALVKGFIADLCKKEVSINLIDEVEYHWYESDKYSEDKLKARKEMLGLVGNENAFV